MRHEGLLAAASFRLALAYSGLFTASIAVVTAVVFAGMSKSLDDQARTSVCGELELLRQGFEAQGRDSLARAVTGLVARRRTSPFVYAYRDPQGRLVAGDEIVPANVAAGWLSFEAPAPGSDDRERESFLGRSALLRDGGRLVVARNVDDLDDFRDLLLAGSAWTIAVAVVLALGGGALMSRFILRRIDAVTATAARITAGDLRQRVALSGSGDEFDRLAAQFNAMLDRILELMGGLRQVTDDIAHDLRTPLGRLRNQLEAMLREPRRSASCASPRSRRSPRPMASWRRSGPCSASRRSSPARAAPDSATWLSAHWWPASPKATGQSPRIATEPWKPTSSPGCA